jgi:orotate phosphoribosyltransferase
MDYLTVFKNTGALLEGHFELTSGLHSQNYFQCAKVLQHPVDLEYLALALAKNFEHDDIDVVISPAVGGIVIGTELGRKLKKRTIFAERKDKKMEIRRGFEIRENENVLVVEDVVTTGGSVEEVIECVKSHKGKVVGVAFIVDRSNGAKKFNVPKQFSLLKLNVETYEANNCPMCKEGTVAVKPGSRNLKK